MPQLGPDFARAGLLGIVDGTEALGHMVSTRAFAVGLLYGALAFLVSGVLAALRHRSTEGCGLAFAIAALLAMRDTFGAAAAPVLFFVALALLALGGSAAVRIRGRSWAPLRSALGRAAFPLVPGAIVLAIALPSGSATWMRAAVATSTVVASVLLADFDRVQGPGGAPFALFFVAVGAMYLAVPDTELPLIALGCSAPLVFLSVPQPLRRFGPAGAAAAVGTFAWVAVIGARGRPGSFVGAVAALGLLLVEPIARWLPRSSASVPRRHRFRAAARSERWIVIVAVAVLAQAVFGLFCSRIVAREDDIALALLVSVPALVLLCAAAPWLLPVRERQPRRPARARRFARMH